MSVPLSADQGRGLLAADDVRAPFKGVPQKDCSMVLCAVSSGSDERVKRITVIGMSALCIHVAHLPDAARRPGGSFYVPHHGSLPGNGIGYKSNRDYFFLDRVEALTEFQDRKQTVQAFREGRVA